MIFLYNKVKSFNQNEIPTPMVASICGSLSSMASLMCVHPFDNLRVR